MGLQGSLWLLGGTALKEGRARRRDEGGGIRHGQVARIGGLAEPLSLGGAAPCFEKPVCLSEVLTSAGCWGNFLQSSDRHATGFVVVCIAAQTHFIF